VQVIVNQRRTDAQRYARAFIKAVRRAGVDASGDQSIMVALLAVPTVRSVHAPDV
jgi:hypothetical protein